MARTVPGVLGDGLGWPSPQFHSGPQQEELSLSGITMALLGPSITSFPTLDISGLVPRTWVPGQPVKDPQFTPARHRFLCTPRQCQYSPCAKGTQTHTHTHACAHACTHTADVCVLTCTPASSRDTSPLPMLQQTCKAHALLLDPLDPTAMAALLLGASLLWTQISRTQSWHEQSLLLRRGSGPSQACPLEPRCWDPPAFPLPFPIPTLDLHSLFTYSLTLVVLS